MSSSNILHKIALIVAISCALSTPAYALKTLTEQAIAQQLGWVHDPTLACKGYYLDQPFLYPTTKGNNNSFKITSGPSLFSKSGTSVLEGDVSLTRFGQQLTAHKAFLYRNPKTQKLSSMEMIGNVRLREPDTVVIAKRGRYYFHSSVRSLLDIFYRTTFSTNTANAHVPTNEEIQKKRKIDRLTAWGTAHSFSQKKPGVFELTDSSFSTCPPINTAWKVKASHIVLNKNTGRGYATNARLQVKGVPIFYWPYINFSLDDQRKSGFLWPTLGTSNKWGPYIFMPIYINIAPNYDMTFTPGFLSKRGIQLNDQFRYLTGSSSGDLSLSVLPNDSLFADFKDASAEKYGNNTDPTIQAELNRLLGASPHRKAVVWRNSTRFNTNWTSNIDFSYAGDDYYLRDFGGKLHEATQNQLLQEADLNYKSQHWNFIGRLQAYQTLHPIDEAAIANQYRRFPQLILDGDYPNQYFGLNYFVHSEATHFDIRHTPGAAVNLPIGNRFHLQPGVYLPITTPYLFFNPRFQLALTQYQLRQTKDTMAPDSIKRVVPIFDIASGLTFSRNISFMSHPYKNTLEPQVYYTYIPYRNQASIPIFDTAVNTLTYDQLFNYNRFSSIDRIGDANQMGAGVTTRLIDKDTGFEKAKLGLGAIIYFANRRVTFCNDDSCTDNPQNHTNEQRLSPFSGTFDYHLNNNWKLGLDAIWNPVSKQISNSTLNFHYQPSANKIFNFGFNYVRNGEAQSSVNINTAQNNLKLADISFAWPVTHALSAIGRWSQDLSRHHFQNLLYGVQYDTCCWELRFVGSRSFTNLNNANNPEYNNEFYLQFAFKGLGNIGTGSAAGLLSAISGYNTEFGQVL